MNSIVILALILSTNKVELQTVTSGPGSYYVLSTQDYWHWTVVASGYTPQATHVSITLPRKRIEFFRAEFQPAKP